MSDRNRLYTIEVLESSSKLGTDPPHIFWNIRLVREEERSERTRLSFHHRPSGLPGASMSNVSGADTIGQYIAEFLKSKKKDLEG